jgi:NAD(P)H-hydrate epimerase
VKLVTAAEMRRLEQAAVAAGVSEAQLMEEAGLAAAQEVWMTLGTLEERRILVLCGPGNNGGDGLVAARHLADWGAGVLVYLLKSREGDPLVEELALREVPIAVATNDDSFGALESLLAASELVVDALLGTGRARPIDGDLAEVLRRLQQARSRPGGIKTLAVDLPTGVDADSGAADPLTVPADQTVTFGFAKAGLYLPPGSAYAGKVQVVDIGIPKDAVQAVDLELMDSRWALATLPPRPPDGNKGTFGKLLVIGGSRRYRGAPVLAALGAYRAGAGLVTVACPQEIVDSVAAVVPEATFFPLQAAGQGTLDHEALVPLQDVLPDYDAFALGPGMGNDPGTVAFVRGLLLALPPNCSLLVDADGLNNLAQIDDWPRRLPPGTILTPHPGEMARLSGMSVEDIQAARIETARRLAPEWSVCLALKGAGSVVCAPDGGTRLSPWSTALLATAGTGDVLTGAIGGYLAQGVPPFDAASLGVYLHGAAADTLAEQYLDSGLLASELAAGIARAAKRLKKPELPPVRFPGGQPGLY